MNRPRPLRRVRRDDDGIALVLVLLFVLVTGVLVTALLTQSFSTFTAARTANSAEQRLYAAGGGIDWGIQQLRAGALAEGERACNRPGATPTVLTAGLEGGVLSIGAHDVTVTCQTTAGHDVGAGGWSVFITDPAGGITTSALPAAPRSIFGAVYNAGGWDIDAASPVQMVSGEVVGAPGCGPTPPAGLDEDPGSAPWGCAPVALATPPPPVDLAAAVAAAPARAGGSRSGTCTTYLPGRYTVDPGFAKNRDGEGRPVVAVNHLQPGVYVFDFPIDVDGDGVSEAFHDVTVVGGEPAPLASEPAGQREATAFADVDLSDCQPDANADDHGSGVVIVLEGTPGITLSGASSLELYSWLDPAQPGGGVSLVRSVDAEPSDPALAALATTPSDEARVAIHGNVYLPTRGILLEANGAAAFTGGVVAADLRLLTTSDGAGTGQPWPIVSNERGAGGRDITLVASTTATPSERSLAITTTLNISNSGARPLLVEGWSVAP